MKNKKLMNLIGDIDDKHIIEAEPREAKNRKNKALVFSLIAVPIAVGFAAVMIFLMPFAQGGKGEFALELSNGVTVKSIDNLPDVSSSFDLVWLTEEELFSDKIHDRQLVAFEGVIEDIQNIVIDYNGIEDHQAIAKIYVSDVLRGDVEEGAMIDLLLPGPVNSNVNVSETTISSQLSEGQRGIFMPLLYDENSYSEINDRRLYSLDLAPAGFSDGERWMFLQSEEGLIYNREAYPSLGGAKDLDEAKEIIKSKIE